MKSLSLLFMMLACLVFVGCEGGKTSPDPAPVPADKWNQKAGFGGAERAYAAGFVIGDKLYVGTGLLNSKTLEKANDFWEYNTSSGTWTRKADFPGGARFGAAGFAIGSKGYLGTGENESMQKDFWEYDPAADRWTRKLDFAGAARRNAASFVIGNKGYIGTGIIGADQAEDFWEYNPTTDKWTQKANFGGGVNYGAAVFVIEDKGYLMGGFHLNNSHGDLWQYTPATNQWEKKTNFKETFVGSSAFAIGKKGYLLGGSTDQFLEYDPVANKWATKDRFTGSPREFAVGCAVGEKGYVATGITYVPTEYGKDLWEYTP